MPWASRVGIPLNTSFIGSTHIYIYVYVYIHIHIYRIGKKGVVQGTGLNLKNAWQQLQNLLWDPPVNEFYLLTGVRCKQSINLPLFS